MLPSTSAPSVRPQDEPRSRCFAEIVAVRDGTAFRPAGGRVRVVVMGDVTRLRAGDRVRIYGELSRVAAADNPGQLDPAARERGERRLAEVFVAEPAAVELLQPAGRFEPLGGLEDARDWARRQLETRIPRERRGLATALLLGGYDGISDEQRDGYLKSGTVHILSISGLHIGMLSASLFGMLYLGLLPRRWGLAGIVLLTGGYCLLVGAEAPVTRATLLVFLACGGLGLMRRQSPWNALAAAAIVVLVANPADLFRVGPQLSFLSVFALIQFAGCLSWESPTDPLRRLLEETEPLWLQGLRWTGRFLLGAMTLSAAVWLVTLPRTLGYFHLISPAVIVLNVLLSIPVAVALIAGFLTILLGGLPWLPDLTAAVCDFGLATMETIVPCAVAVPAAYCWAAGPALWWTCGFYVLYGGWLLIGMRRLPVRRACAIGTLWAAFGAVVAWGFPPPNELRTTFLSVGHGLAVVVEPPGEAPLLYDCGMLGSGERAGRIVSDFLRSRGHDRIAAVVLSHADIDHYDGLPYLVERFPIAVVYAPPGMFAGPARTLGVLRERLDRARIPRVDLTAGRRLTSPAGTWNLRCLHPPAEARPLIGMPFESDNAGSLVAELTFAGRTILLTGDLEGIGLRRLLAGPATRVDVLLAPHHGSANSEPAALAARLRPVATIVSAGRRNEFETARKAYEEAGSRFYRTADCGAITVRLRAGPPGASPEPQIETYRRIRSATPVGNGTSPPREEPAKGS